jgi:predicted ATPase
VTLLRIGGIGKTRLAPDVADASRESIEDFLVVDLASLHSGNLIDGALLEAAGIGSQSGQDAVGPRWHFTALRMTLISGSSFILRAGRAQDSASRLTALTDLPERRSDAK